MALSYRLLCPGSLAVHSRRMAGCDLQANSCSGCRQIIAMDCNVRISISLSRRQVRSVQPSLISRVFDAVPHGKAFKQAPINDHLRLMLLLIAILYL